LNHDALGGLYAPSGGIIEPYRFVFALTECAHNNDVDVLTDFQVSAAVRDKDLWRITSDKGDEICARYAVNAAGLYADRVSLSFNAETFVIKPRKGEEYLLDRNSDSYPNHVLFPTPAENSKGILVIPTVEGTTMIGPTAQETDNKEDLSTTQANLDSIFTNAKHMVPSVSRRDIITAFTGVRPVLEGNDFYIDISKKVPHLIQVAGIQSPGLTASPAIAEYVKELLEKDGLRLLPKPRYVPQVEKNKTAREQTPQSMAELIERDPRFGHIVCRCETISEAEIVEAIRKGHTTLDGIKFYTRAGMGRCQGGFCTYKILKILARETGKDISEFTKRGEGSRLIARKLHGANSKSVGD
jgi:glycerol-3-phosphate dehydrogenase